MKKILRMIKLHNFSFGATSAVVTGLAIIVGFSAVHDAKVAIISALLIIAIADNISDSFGIHIHQESQRISTREVRITTVDNFITRLIIIFVLIFFMIVLPINFAVILSIIFGLTIIIILSYFISKEQKANPYSAIFQHVAIAVIVMVGSFFLRELITKFASKF